MGCLNKSLLLLIILAFVASSIITVKPANAQPIPAPSTPTFTVKLVDNSYTTPISTTTSTDPYTNETTNIRTGGQYVKNFTIEIIIDNQALPPSLNSSKYSIYYPIRLKPHFEEKWIFGQYGELAPCNNSLSPDPSEAAVAECFQNIIPEQSDGQYTIFSIDGNSYKPKDQIDFQVKAVIGHTFNLWEETYTVDHYSYGIPRYGDTKVLAAVPSITQDSEGNWSTIQTLTMPVTSPTSTPAVPEFSWLAIQFALMIMVAVAGLLVYFKKRKH
jgi:hypothetical protein